jgi:tRNA 2-thiouridine synthesizing protein A
MRCPQPVLRLAVETAGLAPGTVVEIAADCATFEQDVRTFCERRKKTLLGVERAGPVTRARLQL